MRLRNYFAALLLLLSGCIGGAPVAQNVSQAIGLAQATIKTVANDVQDAWLSGYISDSQMGDYKKQLQAAKSNVDFAIDAYALGNQAEVEDRLQATHLVLQMIITGLKDHGAKTHDSP